MFCGLYHWPFEAPEYEALSTLLLFLLLKKTWLVLLLTYVTRYEPSARSRSLNYAVPSFDLHHCVVCCNNPHVVCKTY